MTKLEKATTGLYCCASNRINEDPDYEIDHCGSCPYMDNECEELEKDALDIIKSYQMHWKELKETIEEMRDNSKVGTTDVEAMLTFILNMMSVLEGHIERGVYI